MHKKYKGLELGGVQTNKRSADWFSFGVVKLVE
jgi:hypothetical protein